MRVSNPSPSIDQVLLQLGGDAAARRGLLGREGILLLVAVLTAVSSFAGERAPWWYPYVVGTFVGVGAFVLVQNFVWPPAAEAARWFVRRRRLDLAARELSTRFHHLVGQFARLVNPESTETLSRYMWNLACQDPGWRVKLPGLIPPWYFADFFGLFRRRLDGWNGRYEELKNLGQDFNSVVTQYQQVCVRPTLDALRQLDGAQLPTEVRRKANLLREEYAAFVREYRAFGQAANSRCEEQAFADYLEVPEPI
jgi:hypothetical protein